MTKQQKAELALIPGLRKKFRAGDAMAGSNIAAAYRIVGRPQLAFQWWKKIADKGDAEDSLEVAYCYQHGIGVRKNRAAAERFYNKAIRSKRSLRISPYSQEEAQYLLAAMLLAGNPSAKVRTLAVGLLRKANGDGDYAQAKALLESIRSGKPSRICFCRRGLKHSFGGSIGCPIHK